MENDIQVPVDIPELYVTNKTSKTAPELQYYMEKKRHQEEIEHDKSIIIYPANKMIPKNLSKEMSKQMSSKMTSKKMASKKTSKKMTSKKSSKATTNKKSSKKMAMSKKRLSRKNSNMINIRMLKSLKKK
jgi:hypothetical protein